MRIFILSNILFPIFLNAQLPIEKSVDSLQRQMAGKIQSYLLFSIQSLKKDSVRQWIAINKLQYQVNAMDSEYSIKIAALIKDSIYKAGQIRIMKGQIAQLQNVNSLTGSGSVKIVYLGGVAYAVSNDSSSKYRSGNMTPYMWNALKSIISKPNTISTIPTNTIPVHSIPNDEIITTRKLPKDQ